MSKWQPIETAPKDGTEIYVLPVEWGTDTRPHFKVKWWPEGDSWADENGNPCDAGTGTIQVTGVWESTKKHGGWFQPNEVSHWQPIES